MRVDLAQVPKANSGKRDQVMDNAHVGFRDDPHVEVEQMIVVFMHGAGQRIFDWDDGVIDLVRGEGLKHALKAGQRTRDNARPKQLRGRFLAERAELTLKACEFFPAHLFHCGCLAAVPSHRRASAEGRESRSSTRSTL